LFNFFNKSSHEIVALNIDSQNLTCSWFKKHKNNNLINLVGYKRYAFENLEVCDLNVYNQLKLNYLLQSFFNEYNLKNPYVYLSLSGHQILEKIVILDHIPQSSDEFNLEKNENISWSCYQIEDKEKFFFYIAGMQHALVFQYKIFAFNTQLNLSKLTTETASLMSLSNYISKLKLVNEDVYSCKQNITNIIKSCNINDYLYTKLDINLEQEKFFILKNLGLFLLSK